MKRLNIFRLESGFSIMEVMIAAALLGVVTVGVMQITKNMTKSTKTQAQQVEFNQIQTQIQSLLRDEYSCEATLLGVSPSGSGSTITQIKRKKADGSTAVVFESGKSYGSSTSPIFLRSMAIKNYISSTGIGDFYIEMNKGRKNYDSMNATEKATVLATSYGTAVVSRTIKLSMVLDGSGNIKDCVSDKDDYTSGACGMIDGDWSDKVNCKSINVQGNGVEPSITAETYLHVKSGLNVGSALSGDPGNGMAIINQNLDVRNAGTVKNDLQVTSGNLIFNDGDARINQETGGNLYIENNAGSAGANIIAGRTTGARTTVTPTSVTVNKNGTIGAGLALEVIGNTTLTGSGSTTVTLKVGNSDIEFNGTNLVLKKPPGGVVEYDDGSTIEQVASQGFVNAQLSRALTGDPATLSTLLSNLSTLIGANPTLAISASVCGFYTEMIWTGTRCVDRRNTDCPANQMMVGFNNGLPQCIPYVKTNQSCPAGQLWTGVNTAGDKICANADTQIGSWVDAKIDAAGKKQICLNHRSGTSYNPATNACTWGESRQLWSNWRGCWNNGGACGGRSEYSCHWGGGNCNKGASGSDNGCCPSTCGLAWEDWYSCYWWASRSCTCYPGASTCGGTSCSGWSPGAPSGWSTANP